MEKGTSTASKYLRPGELLDMCVRINDGGISGYSCWEPMALSLELLDYPFLTADRLAARSELVPVVTRTGVATLGIGGLEGLGPPCAVAWKARKTNNGEAMQLVRPLQPSNHCSVPS
jgi:hypothetical protein